MRLEKRIIDVDEVAVAVNEARAHAQALGKPLNLSRIALLLGITTDELGKMQSTYEENKDDESAQAVASYVRMACTLVL